MFNIITSYTLSYFFYFYNIIREDYIERANDYKIEKVKKSEGSGGHNLEKITLTPEVSKKICLSTNSKMGGQVQLNNTF